MPDEWDFSTRRRTEQPQPIITYGICALCVIATLVYHNPTEAPAFARWGPILAPSAEQIWDGAYWGLLTTFFVHGNIAHILFNMMVFLQFGRAMEASMSPWAYILFLTASATVSCGCEMAIMGQPGIGASGA